MFDFFERSSKKLIKVRRRLYLRPGVSKNLFCTLWRQLTSVFACKRLLAFNYASPSIRVLNNPTFVL